MNIATIEIGDWSKDGHNQSEKVTIQFPDSLINENLEAFYKLGSEATGFDLMKFCDEYEDNLIPTRALIDLFVQADKYQIKFDKNCEGDSVSVDAAGQPLLSYWNENEFSEIDPLTANPQTEYGDLEIDTFVYAGLWILLVNVGLQSTGHTERVRIPLTNDERPRNYNIGGYGLFWG